MPDGKGWDREDRGGGAAIFTVLEGLIAETEEALRLVKALVELLAEDWIGIAQAAGIVGVSQTSIRRMIVDHRLAAYVDDGNSWHVSRQHAALIATARKRPPRR